MAYAHILFDANTQFGRKLRRFLDMSEESDDLFTDVRDAMIQMRDGDGSQAVHYARATQLFGFDSDSATKAGFDELDSAYSKTSGNGSVSNVRSARDQMFAKLRG